MEPPSEYWVRMDEVVAPRAHGARLAHTRTSPCTIERRTTVRKILALVATGALAVTMSSGGRASTADAGKDSIAGGTKGTIGVAMPTKTSQRWIKDGDAMTAQLEAAGYKVNLQYANDA